MVGPFVRDLETITADEVHAKRNGCHWLNLYPMPSGEQISPSGRAGPRIVAVLIRTT
jgi:hypothetical protein